MLNALRQFFEHRIAPRADDAPGASQARARVAAAALLVEVVRGDDEFTPVERQAVLAAVRRKFGLDAGGARDLLALAESEARDAHDFWQFTSRINAEYSPERKQQLIEELWRVAWADDVLHRHEEHLIRRVAQLLHVSDREFIRAKLRVQAGREADAPDQEES